MAFVPFGPSVQLECSLDEGAHWFRCQGTQWTDETVSLLARAIVDGDTSRTVRHRILHVDHDWTLTLENLPDNQYMAGGLTALIDGIDGGNDFRTGEWQGYWGTDMVARIDLGAVEEVTSISLGALQDIKPWIWMPERVTFLLPRTETTTTFSTCSAPPPTSRQGGSGGAISHVDRLQQGTLEVKPRHMGPSPSGIWAEATTVGCFWTKFTWNSSLDMAHDSEHRNPFLDSGLATPPCIPSVSRWSVPRARGFS